MKADNYKYGELNNGRDIDLIELWSDEVTVKIINYGCRLIEINTPDKYGVKSNILLNYYDLSSYENDEFYMGAVLGRCANRIKNGELKIDDEIYHLSRNENRNHLHGGKEGFDKKIWQYKIVEAEDSVSVVFSYLSKDMEEGYPGNLNCSVEYRLIKNKLIIELSATTDKTTTVNLSIHPYFNLTGDFSQNILNHGFMFSSNAILEVDKQGILTGRLIDVINTPMDLSCRTNLLGKINTDSSMLQVRGGFDHSYLFEDDKYDAKIVINEPKSGRTLEMKSTANLVHFYSGNYFNGSYKHKNSFEKYGGFALEPQYFLRIGGEIYPYVLLKNGEIFKNHIEIEFENE